MSVRFSKIYNTDLDAYQFLILRTVSDMADPMQLMATHLYVVVGLLFSALSSYESPALSSLSSLNQSSLGVGTPITLHSKATVPFEETRASSSSRKVGIR